ncbi:MAG: SiaB family protein kinase [Bacteroidota bacterium]
MKYVYDLHNTMLNHNLILVYEGEFTQEITKSILSMAERNMDSLGEESSIKRKVFNVMVEALQNIVKHGDDIGEGLSANRAIFIIGKNESQYQIVSGNSVKSETADKLKDKIDQINSLDKDGLKSLYKDIIRNNKLSEKGGAGLGFVDMARKSGSKLEYSFESVEGDISFFSLKTTIERF